MEIENQSIKCTSFRVPKQKVVIHSLPEAGLYPETREVEESLVARLDLNFGVDYRVFLELRDDIDPYNPSCFITLLDLYTNSNRRKAEKVYEQYLETFKSGNYRIHLYPKNGVELLK